MGEKECNCCCCEEEEEEGGGGEGRWGDLRPMWGRRNRGGSIAYGRITQTISEFPYRWP